MSRAASGGKSGRRPVVFLDRDGTLNREVNHLGSVEQLRLLPGAAEAVRRLNSAGFAVVLVSNQSGVGRGYFDLCAVDAIHDALRRRLGRAGARLDAIYFCPHRPEDGCACRKPAPGLVLRASRELELSVDWSYTIGDQVADLALARAIGARGVLVLTGHGRRTQEELGRHGLVAAHVARDVLAAARWVIADRKRRATRRHGGRSCGARGSWR